MIWRLVLLFALSLGAAQAQIQSAPISISEEGETQKPGEDPEVARARSELEASKIKPSKKDGQETPPAPESTEQEAKKSEDALEVAEDQSPDGSLTKKKEELAEQSNQRQWKRVHLFAARRWFRLNVGRVWSSWSDVAPELKDGSLLTGFRLVQPIEDTGYSVGLGIDFLHGSGDSFNAESIRSTHVVLENEYSRAFAEHFSFVAGLSLEYADTNIRKVIANNQNEVTYRKYAAGSTFGVVPAFGLRARPSESVHIDLVPGYAFYFSSPEDKMGGLSLRLRLNIAL